MQTFRTMVIALVVAASTAGLAVDCGRLEDCDHEDCACQFAFYACEPFKQEDDKLNAAYRRLLDRARDDAALVERIKKAQRAWVAFRDAQMEALTAGGGWGDASPWCEWSAKQWLTERRTQDLESMLEEPGGNENDCTWVRPLPEETRQRVRQARCS